jgi:succinate dehydrogenase / fumarate reductase, cytochrome b subunit
MAIFSYLKSTILSKIVMAVTGVLLVLYIIGHTVGNMQVYLGPDPLNTYAHFLQSLGEGLWIIRIVLGIALVLHIITSIKLKLHNMGAKPDKYQVKNYVKATLTSRTMIWTGIMIFAFLIFHLAHFTTGDVNSEDYAKNHPEYYKGELHLALDNPDGTFEVINKEWMSAQQELASESIGIVHSRPDVYYMMVKSFQKWWISVVYIIGVILLGFHLNHAIQSMIQTLGLNHPKYFNCFERASTWLSIIIVLCLISIPITILTGLVGGCL